MSDITNALKLALERKPFTGEPSFEMDAAGALAALVRKRKIDGDDVIRVSEYGREMYARGAEDTLRAFGHNVSKGKP